MDSAHPQRLPARRHFFRALVRETWSFVNEAAGIPQLCLDDIPQLPDEQFQQLIPAIVEEVELSYREGFVVATFERTGQSLPLFASDSPEMRLFGCFDGTQSIAAICRDLIARRGAAPDKIFETVKEFFLRLLRAGVCMPANPVSQTGSGAS